MIVSFIALTSVLLISPSWGALQEDEFEEYLDRICFELDKTTGIPLVNGQVNPLAQTLENFISLAEKFEQANPVVGLKEELFYFIRNYTYDNFEYTKLGDRTVWVPKGSNLATVNELWERDEAQRNKWPYAQDPFTEAEKCSIFYTLSHSIIRTPRNTDVNRAPTNGNSTRNSVMRSFNLKAQYPMEVGVVAIRGTNLGVALGKVLIGMYIGLNEDRKKPINEIKEIKNIDLDLQAAQVDPLYTLTLAEVISLSTWRAEAGLREKLAEDGSWVSAPIGNDLDASEICPMIYKLNEGTESFLSLSSMRGAADGFVLGRIIKAIERRNRNTKLSQILRMYYSRGGISERDDDLGQVWVSFCNRETIVNALEQTLQQQVLLYELLAGAGSKNAKTNSEYAWKYYNEQKSAIYGYGFGGIKDYCGKSLTIDKPEELPLESPLDIIAVIDTSNGEENVKRQQMILGYLAKQLDLSYSGGRMTVLTDQKETADANGKVTLKSIVTDSHSASCVACNVTQFASDNTPSAPEDEVIVAIDQLLQAKKENETKYNGVTGKVVIYFNFNEDVPNARNDKAQRRVETALRELHLRHQDVSMYALGRAPELVKKYARNDLFFVLSAVDEAESTIGQKLYDKLSTSPATLQYSGCEDGKNENAAVYEDFVSQNAIQHWSMPATYFHKSRNLKFTFESQFGPVRVCHSRATVSPELQKISCQDVPVGQKVEFKDSNPCKGFTSLHCAPFNFAILGINSSATDSKQEHCSDTNSENRCKTLDQIKFRVSHEGIRCSGCIGLVSTPVLFVLSVILLNILTKKF